MTIEVAVGRVSKSTTGVEEGVDVNFMLTIDGVEHEGEVTLLRHEQTGDWSSWGSLDNWLDGRTCNLLRDLPKDVRDEARDEILSATSAAAEREAASV